GGTLMRRLVATTTRPAISTSPALGFSKPATMRKVVVLPQPLGPSSVTTSPCSTLNDTLSTAVSLPKILTRLLTSRKVWLMDYQIPRGATASDCPSPAGRPSYKS